MEQATRQIKIGYHFHLISVLASIYRGNLERACFLVERFIKNASGIDVLLYTPHNDTILLHKDNRRCEDVLFELLTTKASEQNCSVLRGVEVSCVFEKSNEAIHLGIIPFDQETNAFDWFSSPSMVGLNCFNPFVRSGKPQFVYPVDEVLEQFQGKALIVINHPELHTESIQTELIKLIERYNFPVEWNLAAFVSKSFLPFLWNYCGKHSFACYQSLVGWDTHGTGSFIRHCLTEVIAPDRTPQAISLALQKKESTMQCPQAALGNLVERTYYQIEEFYYALEEARLRKEIMRVYHKMF